MKNKFLLLFLLLLVTTFLLALTFKKESKAVALEHRPQFELESSCDGLDFSSTALSEMVIPGEHLKKPVYFEYVQVDGLYYAFLVNNWPGGLVRLDFGTSLLNKPEVLDFGNLNGAIPNNTEGLKIINQNGIWTLFLVGGDPRGGEPSRITKIDLGRSILNNTPKTVSWGNQGEMDYPHDLEVFEYEEKWYGLTVNFWSNSLTRIEFSKNFETIVDAVNMGNPGGLLDGPSGLKIIREKDLLTAFITNAYGNSISRIRFNNTNQWGVEKADNITFRSGFRSPWDLQLLTNCSELQFLVLNSTTGDIQKVNLGKGSFSDPQISTVYNDAGGTLYFPHSLSSPFSSEDGVHFIIPDADANSLMNLKIKALEIQDQQPSDKGSIIE